CLKRCSAWWQNRKLLNGGKNKRGKTTSSVAFGTANELENEQALCSDSSTALQASEISAGEHNDDFEQENTKHTNSKAQYAYDMSLFALLVIVVIGTCSVFLSVQGIVPFFNTLDPKSALAVTRELKRTEFVEAMQPLPKTQDTMKELSIPLQDLTLLKNRQALDFQQQYVRVTKNLWHVSREELRRERQQQLQQGHRVAAAGGGGDTTAVVPDVMLAADGSELEIRQQPMRPTGNNSSMNSNPLSLYEGESIPDPRRLRKGDLIYALGVMGEATFYGGDFKTREEYYQAFMKSVHVQYQSEEQRRSVRLKIGVSRPEAILNKGTTSGRATPAAPTRSLTRTAAGTSTLITRGGGGPDTPGGTSSASGTPQRPPSVRNQFSEDMPATPTSRPDLLWDDEGGFYTDVTATNWIVHDDGMPQEFFSHDDLLDEYVEMDHQRERVVKLTPEEEKSAMMLAEPEPPEIALERTVREDGFWGVAYLKQLAARVACGVFYAFVPIASLAHLFVTIFVHNVVLQPSGPSTPAAQARERHVAREIQKR
ncbi:unnamed protein product, partial [Amoebophrya sp. A120]